MVCFDGNHMSNCSSHITFVTFVSFSFDSLKVHRGISNVGDAADLGCWGGQFSELQAVQGATEADCTACIMLYHLWAESAGIGWTCIANNGNICKWKLEMRILICIHMWSDTRRCDIIYMSCKGELPTGLRGNEMDSVNPRRALMSICQFYIQVSLSGQTRHREIGFDWGRALFKAINSQDFNQLGPFNNIVLWWGGSGKESARRFHYCQSNQP